MYSQVLKDFGEVPANFDALDKSKETQCHQSMNLCKYAGISK
jgi:hypothetical protein